MVVTSVVDPGPDPLVRDTTNWIRILLSSSKNIDYYCFVTFYLGKKDVNVPSKSSKEKKIFC
jgi:hypothetical protein